MAQAMTSPDNMPVSATPVDGTAASAPASNADDDALRCMTLAIAYEAGQEPAAGQRAVGDVILNRLRRPGFPKTVCGVVFQGSTRRTGCQFTFTCDGSMRRTLTAATMERARLAAQAVLATPGSAVPGATHYHADYVRPYWAASLVRIAQIGNHIFYRLPAGVDTPGSAHGEAGAAPPTDSTPAPAPKKPQVFAPWGLSLSDAPAPAH